MKKKNGRATRNLFFDTITRKFISNDVVYKKNNGETTAGRPSFQVV
jgi:hypothetical protein